MLCKLEQLQPYIFGEISVAFEVHKHIIDIGNKMILRMAKEGMMSN